MSYKQSLINAFVQAKMYPHKAVKVLDVLSSYQVVISFDNTYFDVQYINGSDVVEENCHLLFTAKLDNGALDTAVCSSKNQDKYDHALLLDKVIPVFYDFMYNPPKELHYVTLVIDYDEFETLVRKICAESKIYPKVVVDCSYDTYYGCRFIAENDRLVFF